MSNMDYFLETGVHHFDQKVDANNSKLLLQKVFESREFGPGLFLQENDFKINPVFKGVNPTRGRNLAEKLDPLVKYIESDANIQEGLGKILGEAYEVKDRKFVCGVPKEWIPGWVQVLADDTGVNNLGPYIKPEYRDITYFSGIDFHQDIIDWPESAPNFITMYVYLDDVGLDDAPLHLMLGSHAFGASSFPHRLGRVSGNLWSYKVSPKLYGEFECYLLTGGCGSVSLWHPFLLHGTQPTANGKPRISLRYLIKMTGDSLDKNIGIGLLNNRIKGDMCLSSTRVDLGKDGAAILKGSHVNKIKY